MTTRLAMLLACCLLVRVAPAAGAGPTGACCLTADTRDACIVLSQSACEQSFGIYQGDGTTCDGSCLPGACCLPDRGGCNASVSQIACEQVLDGYWFGAFTACPSECAIGACCVQTKEGWECLILDELLCIKGYGGYFQGADTTCEEDSCVVGACCAYSSGPECFETIEEDCTDSFGGIWQGPGTNCIDDCAPGACCYEKGGDEIYCYVTDVYDCEQFNGGVFQGMGTNCEDSCEIGACCIAFDVCEEVSEIACAQVLLGTWLGEGTTCGECAATYGACCMQLEGTWVCSMETAIDCEKGMGGYFQGKGSTCDDACPVGACCYFESGAACTLTIEDECDLLYEGLWQGEGSSCAADCAVGACCIPGKEGDFCVELDPYECLYFNEGDYQGAGTECSHSCDIGACCFGKDECDEINEIQCLQVIGGSWLGAGSTCEDCLEAEGACCLPEGTCAILPLDDCDAASGQYQGDDSICDGGCGALIPLGPPNEFPAGGEPIIAAVGDMDLDGLDDVVVAIPAGVGVPGTVQLFNNLGNGVGGWLGLLPQPPIEVGPEPTGVAIGRFDGDQWPDVAVSCRGDDTVRLLFGDGHGGLGGQVILSLPEFDFPAGIGAAPFLGGSVDDLVVTNEGNDTIVLLENVGGFAPGGGFVARQVSGSSDDPTVVEPEDLDNDKDIDAVSVGRTGGKTTLLFNQGTFSPGGGGDVFGPPLELPAGSQPLDVAIADLDLDGLKDIITANSGRDRLRILLNLGNGDFDDSFPLVPVGGQPRSVDAADLDGDGDVDIVVVVTLPLVGDVIQVLANRYSELGVLAFAAPQAIGVAAAPNWVVVGDFDGLPPFDIATANGDSGPSGGSVTVLLNAAGEVSCPSDLNGDGVVNFDDVLIVLQVYAEGGCDGCPADVNGDGVVNLDDVLQVLADAGACPELCPADLDGDGTVDLGDLLLLISAFGDCPFGDCPADIDGSGSVNLLDLLLLLAAWGDCG